VEQDNKGPEAKTQNGFRDKLTTTLRVMGVFIGGLAISSYFGSVLLMIRMPHSNWRFAPFVILPIVLVLGLLRKDDTKVRVVSGCLLPVVVGGCVAGLFFMRAHDWVPVAFGALFAIFFWAHSKSTKRPYLFSSVGSLLAGVLSLQVPWSIEQRCLLTLVGVGLAMSLQGAWVIVRYLQGHPPAEVFEPTGPSSKSSDRNLVRIIHWILGTVEHIQIFFPEFEQRIRTRYQSEISELNNLGFDYSFSDGQSLSLFRLPLLLPAIVVIGLWFKRRPMTLHGGTKILFVYPVLISRNKNSFSEIGDLGVNFNTAFQDGTILVSKCYKDESALGPMIVKYAQKASISDTWTEHQKRIAALEAEGKRVDRQTSFQAWAEISYKETAPW